MWQMKASDRLDSFFLMSVAIVSGIVLGGTLGWLVVWLVVIWH